MRSKIVLVYYDVSGSLAEETIWVLPEKEYFKVDNIPFFAPNLALNDIVGVEVDGDVMYFDDLIVPSGHSTIQIVFFNVSEISRVIKKIEEFGCSWESMEGRPYFAVDIPPALDYRLLKLFLDKEADDGVLDYKEASLSENHN